MCLLSSIEENEMRILNVELHFDYPSREGEQNKATHGHPNAPPPLFVIEANGANCWKFLCSPECLNGDSHRD